MSDDPGVAVRRWRGSAAEFHACPIGAATATEVWAFDVVRPALVLGSSQSAASVDEAAAAQAGVEIVRRRSGGGAVLLEPGDVAWFDAVIPSAVLRAHGVADDVGRAMVWFGRRVQAALVTLGVETAVHDGPMVRTAWSSVVCFDGLGAGELLVGDAKLVGISARRVRAATRFQCVLATEWHPERLVALLAVPRPTVGELRAVATVDAAVGADLAAAVAAALT